MTRTTVFISLSVEIGKTGVSDGEEEALDTLMSGVTKGCSCVETAADNLVAGGEVPCVVTLVLERKPAKDAKPPLLFLVSTKDGALLRPMREDVGVDVALLPDTTKKGDAIGKSRQ
eukprot:930350-Ditylum_brightwellii.AAC.1